MYTFQIQERGPMSREDDNNEEHDATGLVVSDTMTGYSPSKSGTVQHLPHWLGQGLHLRDVSPPQTDILDDNDVKDVEIAAYDDDKGVIYTVDLQNALRDSKVFH